jgi:hypothetical protein
MEKVSLYVKKILALALAAIVFIWASRFSFIDTQFESILILAGAFLLFAFLDFRITGEKPRFLFGLHQSDAFLNQKGGFWNLFKWIVSLFGLAYDLVVWSLWGVYLLFILFAELLLFIKTILFWIIHAIIWFIRQLFPPFVFLFKMVLHYLIYWPWWIYQVSFRNMKTSINKNFYIIALWGTVPALFIVFLFYAIGQLTGIPELVVLSAVFSIIPLVWSYGEIALLRFEQRERDDHTAVRIGYRNGFDAVRSVLFYLLIILLLIVAMIVLNLLGWIPNLSMTLLGITLNINMAISLLLIFLTVILFFAASILPTHILYKPEHENDLQSSLVLLKVIGRRFLRYSFASLPASLFGALLLAIPVLVMLLAFTITEEVKDTVLQVRIEQLSDKSAGMEALDAYRTDVQIKRLRKYQEVPMQAPAFFEELRNRSQLELLKRDIGEARDQLEVRKAGFQKELTSINTEIERVRAERQAESGGEGENGIAGLTAERLDLEEEYLDWEAHQKQCIATMEVDLKELRSVRVQLPLLYLFVGIMFALFGGLVVAVLVAYLGNVWYALYNLKEDDEPTRWCQVIGEIRERDANQPLLGFTLLVIIGVLLFMGLQIL